MGAVLMVSGVPFNLPPGTGPTLALHPRDDDELREVLGELAAMPGDSRIVVRFHGDTRWVTRELQLSVYPDDTLDVTVFEPTRPRTTQPDDPAVQAFRAFVAEATS
jgi:hypothetical protein